MVSREMKTAIKREIRKQAKLGKGLEETLKATRLQFSSINEELVLDLYWKVKGLN